MTNIEFQAFPKIPRLNRDCVITEKLDGTNAQIIITEDGDIGAASRKRLITPDDDNYGFARWVHQNREELLALGPGRHFGEWWGGGIQRGYGLPKGEKRFSLFNVGRWADPASRPSCCHVVPTLYEGPFCSHVVAQTVDTLRECGSVAAPDFMRPEGVIVWHAASQSLFKVTCEKDEAPKSFQQGEAA